MPPEPFSYFDHNQTSRTNGQTVISSCTCPLAYAVEGASYLPTVWISADVLIDLLTCHTWKAAPIAQFAQQIDRSDTLEDSTSLFPESPSFPYTSSRSASRSRRSHHDQGDIKHAAATYRAEIARDWQTQRLDPHIRAHIWAMAQLLPGTAIEIVPQLTSPQLSHQECAAIAEMMHHPIVSCHQETLIAGVFTTWGELFRRRVVEVWSRAGLSYETLAISLELRALPSIQLSGVAEQQGDRLYVAATWGHAAILDTGLIKPDVFQLDLASASPDRRTLGQKFCAYWLSPSQAATPSLKLTPQELSLDHQNQWTLQGDQLQALMRLAHSIRHWHHPALTDGIRIHWSLGELLPRSPQPNHPTDPIIQESDHTGNDTGDYMGEHTGDPGATHDTDELTDELDDRRSVLEEIPVPATGKIALSAIAREDNAQDQEFSESGEFGESGESSESVASPSHLFVHDISPLNSTHTSFWFTEALSQRSPPSPICTAIWHGSGASIGRVTAPAFVFKCSTPNTSNTPVTPPPTRSHPRPGEIWVCHKIPATRLHDLRYAAGVVVEAGSSTSHEVLLARDLGLPIVVGVVGIVDTLNTGDCLEIDANVGDVICYSGSFAAVPRSPQASPPTPRLSTSPLSLETTKPQENTDLSLQFLERSEVQSETRSESPHTIPEPASKLAAWIAVNESQRQTLTQTDGVRYQTDLRVNLSYLDRRLQLDRAWGGIGILRSEMLAFSDGIPLSLNPTPKEQASLHRWLQQQLTLATELCGQRSVFYRVFDRLSPEAALRERGMHLYLEYPLLLDLQLNVLAELHQNGHTQLRLLLPFVRSCAEVEFCWQRLERLGFDRANSPISVWIMAEVPSVLVLLEDYCQMGIAGIVIGTNDLTALLLGLDQENGRNLASLKAAKPALHAAICTLASTTARHGLACQLCYDEIVHDPEALKDFLRAGVTALSVSLDHLPQAEQAIVTIERSQRDSMN